MGNVIISLKEMDSPRGGDKFFHSRKSDQVQIVYLDYFDLFTDLGIRVEGLIQGLLKAFDSGVSSPSASQAGVNCEAPHNVHDNPEGCKKCGGELVSL